MRNDKSLILYFKKITKSNNNKIEKEEVFNNFLKYFSENEEIMEMMYYLIFTLLYIFDKILNIKRMSKNDYKFTRFDHVVNNIYKLSVGQGNKYTIDDMIKLENVRTFLMTYVLCELKKINNEEFKCDYEHLKSYNTISNYRIDIITNRIYTLYNKMKIENKDYNIQIQEEEIKKYIASINNDKSKYDYSDFAHALLNSYYEDDENYKKVEINNIILQIIMKYYYNYKDKKEQNIILKVVEDIVFILNKAVTIEGIGLSQTKTYFGNLKSQLTSKNATIDEKIKHNLSNNLSNVNKHIDKLINEAEKTINNNNNNKKQKEIDTNRIHTIKESIKEHIAEFLPQQKITKGGKVKKTKKNKNKMYIKRRKTYKNKKMG
mgnify:CR=1 FL=1